MDVPVARGAKIVAVAAIAAGLLFHAFVIGRGLDVLAGRYLADDYFYYLGAAWHVAHEGRSTVDGITATNGYQPLFLWYLSAVFLTGAGKIAAIRAGLALQAICLAAAGVGLYAIGARRGRSWSGALAAALINLNLFFVLPTLTGFEMALALAALVWTLWAWEAGRPAALVGVLCSIAILARVDAALAAALFVAALVSRRDWRRALHLVAACAIVLLPWCMWSWTQVGTLAQDSGAVKVHYRGVAAIQASAHVVFSAIPRVLLPGRIVDALSTGSVSWMLTALSTVVLIAAAWQAVRQRENRALAAFGVLLWIAYSATIDPHESGALVRYLFPVWALLVFLLAQAPLRRLRVVIATLLIVHALDMAQYMRWERTAAVPLSYVGTSATLMPGVIERLVPAGDRIGAFDSGALGYFAPRSVINLDGLANHEIVRLRADCRGTYSTCLISYLHDRQIGILAGGTAFGWTTTLPDWQTWPRLYESPPLVDGSHIVLLRVPAGTSIGQPSTTGGR